MAGVAVHDPARRQLTSRPCESASLLKHIAKRSYTIDCNLDRVPRILHGAHPERGATGDDVARHEGHVLREEAYQLQWRKEHVAHGIVLPFLAIEDGPHVQGHGIDFRRDHRSEHTERVEALGPGPLWEGWVLVDDLGRGHVVDAGIAENIIACLGLAHVRASLADYDPELALVDH